MRREETRENVFMNVCLHLGRPKPEPEAMGEFPWLCTEAVNGHRWNRHGNSGNRANVSDVIPKMLK